MEAVYRLGYLQVVATEVIPTIYTDQLQTWPQLGFEELSFSHSNTSQRGQVISRASKPSVLSEC